MLRKTGTKLAIVFLTLTFIFWLTSMVTPGWIVLSRNTYKDHVVVSFNFDLVFYLSFSYCLKPFFLKMFIKFVSKGALFKTELRIFKMFLLGWM